MKIDSVVTFNKFFRNKDGSLKTDWAIVTHERKDDQDKQKSIRFDPSHTETYLNAELKIYFFGTKSFHWVRYSSVY